MLVALHRSWTWHVRIAGIRSPATLARAELGIDPTPGNQRIYLAILNNANDIGTGEADTRRPSAVPSVIRARPVYRETGRRRPDDVTATRFTASVPHLLPADIPDFTARDREVGFVVGCLTRKLSNVVAISGRGGIGEERAHGTRRPFLRDQFPDGQLYASLRSAGLSDPVTPHEVLGRFLTALGVDGLGVPEAFDQRADLYRDLLSERRILVVLDDVTGAEQVLSLIPGGSHCGVLVNGRTRFGAELGAALLDLDVLPPDRAVDLLAATAGDQRVRADLDSAARIAGLCGYLPLAIRIAGAKLASKPHWTSGTLVGRLADEHRRLDEFSQGHLDVRASISLSYAGLIRPAQTLLRRIGDLDLAEISVWVAAAVMDLSPTATEELLEALFDAQLLDATGPDAAGQQRYRLHDLVRLFARERAQAEDPATDATAWRGRAFGAWLTLGAEMHRAIFGGDFQRIRGTTPEHAGRSALPRRGTRGARQVVRCRARLDRRDRAASRGHRPLRRSMGDRMHLGTHHADSACL